MTFWDNLDTSLKRTILAQLSGVFGSAQFAVEPISAHASKRQMIRLFSSPNEAQAATDPNHTTSSAILVLTPDLPEQLAFSAFTKHFLSFHLPVPKIYWEEPSQGLMLLEDLGRYTLFDLLANRSLALDRTGDLAASAKKAYRDVVTLLPTLQIKAGKTVPYERCYPSSSFNRANMLWDTSYFEKEFLSRTKIKFTSDTYSKACGAFVDALETVDSTYFMYRDLQSRNIMVKDGNVYFIDYQGGRRGPLHYDLASLLFQSRAQLPAPFRNELIELYLDCTEPLIPINRQQFIETLQLFVMLRLMQALATYGKVGFGEGKLFFKESIPYAKSMLRELLPNVHFPTGSQYLSNILNEVAISDEL